MNICKYIVPIIRIKCNTVSWEGMREIIYVTHWFNKKNGFKENVRWTLSIKISPKGEIFIRPFYALTNEREEAYGYYLRPAVPWWSWNEVLFHAIGYNRWLFIAVQLRCSKLMLCYNLVDVQIGENKQINHKISTPKWECLEKNHTL